MITGQHKAPALGVSMARHGAWLDPALLYVTGDNSLK